MSKHIDPAKDSSTPSDPIGPVPVPGPPGNQGGDPPPTGTSVSTQMLVENEMEDYGPDELAGAMSGSSGVA